MTGKDQNDLKKFSQFFWPFSTDVQKVKKKMMVFSVFEKIA